MSQVEPTVTWYFNDKEETEMRCGHCVRDNQVWMYAKTAWIAKLAQDVVCLHCRWCPKKDGLERPPWRKMTK